MDKMSKCEKCAAVTCSCAITINTAKATAINTKGEIKEKQAHIDNTKPITQQPKRQDSMNSSKSGQTKF